MKLIRARGRNSFSFSDITIPLASKGVYYIVGENKDDYENSDSNGAGKSNYASEILLQGLFGVNDKGLSAEDAILDRESLSDILTTFKDNGKYYHVYRPRKRGRLSNKLRLFTGPKEFSLKSALKHDGFEEHTKATNALTQDYINEILGCSPDIFRLSVIKGQEDDRNLFDMKDKEFKDLLTELADLAVFDKARELAKEARDKHQREHDELKIEVNEARSQLRSLKGNISDIKEEKNDFKERKEKKVRKKELEIKELRKEIDSYEYDSTIDDRVHELDGEIKTQDKRMSKATEEWKQVMKNIYSLKGRRTTLSESVDRLRETGEGICGYCGQKVDRKILKKCIKEQIEAIEKIETVLKNLQEAQKIISEKQEKIRADTMKKDYERRRLLEQKAQQQEINILNKNLDRLEEELGSIKEEKNPHLKIYKKLKAQRKELKEKVLFTESEYEKVHKRMKDYEYWMEGFGLRGIKGFAFDSMLNLLQDRTNEHLSNLFDDLWVEFNPLTKSKTTKDYSARISQTVYMEGKRVEFKRFSGGQKARIRFAARMACSDIRALRARKKFNLLIFDEPFRGMDRTGRTRLMEMFEKLGAKYRVMVISHNSDMMDYARNIIKVTMKDRKSTVETIK